MSCFWRLGVRREQGTLKKNSKNFPSPRSSAILSLSRRDEAAIPGAEELGNYLQKYAVGKRKDSSESYGQLSIRYKYSENYNQVVAVAISRCF